jgi:hypothetical protein
MTGSTIDDIDAFVLQLIESGQSRESMIAGLSRKSSQFETAGKAKRGKRGRRLPDRGENEFSKMDRVGRLLYFLRHRSPAFGFTDADSLLADKMQDHLKRRNEW